MLLSAMKLMLRLVDAFLCRVQCLQQSWKSVDEEEVASRLTCQVHCFSVHMTLSSLLVLLDLQNDWCILRMSSCRRLKVDPRLYSHNLCS